LLEFVTERLESITVLNRPQTAEEASDVAIVELARLTHKTPATKSSEKNFTQEQEQGLSCYDT
jgi:hypothetical protein